MLNRRFLRIKVYQALYGFWQGDSTNAARNEKELFNGIDRTYDLFLSLLLVFGELRHVAELRMTEQQKKHLPTGDDLKPDRRFVDDRLVKLFSDSTVLRLEAEKRRINWVGNHELFTRMWREVKASPEYQSYMADADPDFSKSQKYLVRMFTDHVANSEALQDVFEGRSIYWLEDLDLASSMVKRLLELMRETDANDLAMADIVRSTKEEGEFVTTLFRKTIEYQEEHEKAIAEHASNWETDRIAYSDMILMQMALSEVRVFDQIPIKVTLNEYIEIAKAYSTPKSKNFINGVLDKIFIEMKINGMIHKVGRGLLEN
ncbi:MAG: transcription antitermination factor NusB [Flavobacteriales bacterium]|nr:transcription antitermination factor NusB [Flavobacteriales bacterium]